MIDNKVDNIVRVLNTKGSVVAIKTDTVYGLVCNAFDVDAVTKIYHLKKRESSKPLSIFVKNIDEVNNYVNLDFIDYRAQLIMKEYWPGALTIVFKKKDSSLDHLNCGLSTIGIRIPDDELLLKILASIDFPLAETSCNISGEREYKNSDEIRDRFGDAIDLIVDGGNINKSIPSTVISFEGKKLKVLRAGTINING